MKAGTPEYHKAYSAEWYRRNKNKVAKRNTAWAKDHPNRIAEIKVRYRSTPAGRAKTLVYSAKRRAQRRNLTFELDWRDIEAVIINGVCEATGLAFVLDRDSNTHVCPLSPSLDRIDPREGYTKKNVRVVVSQFNAAKGQWSESALEKVARAYIKQLERKKRKNGSGSSTKH